MQDCSHDSKGNENEVGEGIKDSGIAREEIFITSKLWNTHHPNAKEGLQKTLDALSTDYLDLYVCRLVMTFLQGKARTDKPTIAYPLACSPCSRKCSRNLPLLFFL